MVYALHRMKFVGIKKVKNNFLTRPGRIQVQNNQNKSRDSPLEKSLNEIQ